ncbi:MAG: hypothetical protein WCW29_04360 [Candidatus Paceibacterota bacterium]|jgi:hypothetical protein
MQNNTLEKLRDPKFYLENFTKIKGKKPGQLIPFILNEAQKDFYNSLRKHNRLITLKARQLGFCLSPDTKILTADLRWVELDDIKKGEEIIAVDEKVLGGPGSSRKMRTAIVENKWDVYEPAFRLKLDNGQELVATAPHRFLCKARGAVHTQWRTVKDIYIGDDIRFISLPWEKSATHDDGWFSGILDGEGSFRYKNHTGAEICACQRTDGEVWQRIKKYLIDRNYTFKEEIDFRKAGEGSKLGDAPVGKAVINRMDELFHIIGVARPSRFIGIHWWEGKKLPCNHGWARVMSIEILGTQRMIDLQTSTKTFIANGFVSHNSTAITGFFYHNTITTPGTTTALIGYNSDLTAELLDKVKTFYKTTPAELRPTIHYNSKYEISFPEIDSKILVLPSTANVGRGYTLSNCLVTELSSWENAEEKMMTLEASVPIDGRLVVESTPRGQGNLFHRMWMDDQSDYIKKEYGWWWGYSKEEIEIVKRRMNNPQKFAQEYGLAFLSSGRAVFSEDILVGQRKNVLKVGDKIIDKKTNEEFIVHEEDGWRIYKLPQNGHFYCSAADTSEGVEGGDYSVATIWDRESGEEVAMYRGLIPPDAFGRKLDKMGRKYNDALMAVEVNNHGLTTLTILKQLVYPSIYFRPAKFDEMGSRYTDKMGWRTTKLTRDILLDDFAQACRDRVLIIHSKEIVDEMSVFVYDSRGDASAQSGFHDDCVFSAAIAFQAFKSMWHSKLDQLDYTKYLPKSFAY